MKISRYSVKHPAVLTMILLALLLFGLLSISSTNMEFISNMDLPQIFVISIYPGASAEDIEKEVVDVLEDDFVTLPDFKSMDSQSMNSVGVVTITFRDGVDPNDQLEEVRNRISQLSSSLPDGLEGEPQAIVGGATMLPVTSFIIEGGELYTEKGVALSYAKHPGYEEIDLPHGFLIHLADVAASLLRGDTNVAQEKSDAAARANNTDKSASLPDPAMWG